jgi:hypothetical protein
MITATASLRLLGPSSAPGSRLLPAPQSNPRRGPKTGRRSVAPGFLERRPVTAIPSASPCGFASVLAGTSHSPLRASVPSLQVCFASTLAGFRSTFPGFPSPLSGFRYPCRSVPRRLAAPLPFPVSRILLSARHAASTGPKYPPFGRGNHPDSDDETAPGAKTQRSAAVRRSAIGESFLTAYLSEVYARRFFSRTDR